MTKSVNVSVWSVLFLCSASFLALGSSNQASANSELAIGDGVQWCRTHVPVTSQLDCLNIVVGNTYYKNSLASCNNLFTDVRERLECLKVVSNMRHEASALRLCTDTFVSIDRMECLKRSAIAISCPSISSIRHDLREAISEIRAGNVNDAIFVLAQVLKDLRDCPESTPSN
jgi:hypothetical protein